MSNKYIYLPSKEGQQWVREKETMKEPTCWGWPYGNELTCEKCLSYQKHLASLKSYLFEGPPGKHGEEVEGELVTQFLDGNGKWEDDTLLVSEFLKDEYLRTIVRAIQPAKREEGIPDEMREAMYYGSLKRRLAKPRTITRTVYDPVTLEEFIEIMLDKSPTCLYHTEYSSKKPAYHITKRIMRSHEGLCVYADSAADKTPIFRSWQSFYRELVIQGLEYIKF